jgi:hypothetical protein
LEGSDISDLTNDENAYVIAVHTNNYK